MSLADRLNLALKKHRLQPDVLPESEEPAVVATAELPNDEVLTQTYETIPETTETTYKTLEEGLASADNHTPDEFGTTVIVVEDIGGRIQLPMEAGKYIVDDIQKRTDGRYEVHLVSGQR